MEESVFRIIEEKMYAFLRGEISQERWCNMNSADRAMLAGAIAGNYATNHPAAAHMLLSRIAAKDPR